MPKPWKPVQMAAKRSWGGHRVSPWNRKPQDLWCNDLAMICNACGTCGLPFWLFGFFVAIGWSNTWVFLMNTSPKSDSRMHIVPWGQHANINNGVLYFSYRLHGLVVELPGFSLSAKGKRELEDGNMGWNLNYCVFGHVQGFMDPQAQRIAAWEIQLVHAVW